MVPRGVRPRIGELLVEAGRLSQEDLQRGLASQRVTRTRLGATLASMGIVTDDEVARSLARQHGVPAALDRHLAGRDPALTARIRPELARALWALPVAMSRGGDGLNLVVCMRDPTMEAVAEIREHVQMPIIASVTGERALRKALDVAYPPPPPQPAPEPTPPPKPEEEHASIDIDFDVDSGMGANPLDTIHEVDESALVELDDQYVNKDHTQIPLDTKKTGTQHAITRVPDLKPDVRVDMRPTTPAAQPAAKIMRLDEAIIAMATADSGDDVVEIAVQALRGMWKAGLVLQVKDKERLALGQAGFGGSVTTANVESIVVPLDQPSVLRTAHDDRRPWAGEATISSTVQDRFLRLFADLKSRTIAVAPILVRSRPVGLAFGLGPLATLPEASAALATLAHAMGEAYLRIILASKKGG